MKITVLGIGYVCSCLSVMLAKHHEVYAVGIDPVFIEAINHKKSIIGDSLVNKMLQDIR